MLSPETSQPIMLRIAWLLAVVALPATAQEPQFIDATASAGIIFEHHDAPPLPGMLPMEQTRFGAGGAVCDFDRDGDLDLYLVDSHGYSNRLFVNDGNGAFTDGTAAAGVGDLGAGHMALFVDLDGDGWDDLVVVNDSTGGPAFGGAGSRIYRNGGNGSFTDVTAGSGFRPVARIVGGATAGDYDLDGDLDLCVVSWFDSTATLYRNEGNFRFRDVTAAAGLSLPQMAVNHWTPVFADLDGDRRQDLFCAVDFAPDVVLRNIGGGRFAFVPGDYHVANDMGVAVADYDRDGDLDLYTTNVTEPGTAPGCNWLYVNDGSATFEDGAGAAGVADSAWGWGTDFLDVDLDGDLDLMAVNGWQQPQWQTPAVLFLNDGSGGFTEGAAAAGIAHGGNSRALIPFDADGDGDLDVVVTDIYAPVTYYENVTERGGRRWSTVRLRGTRSNTNGVGARVTVRAGGRTQVEEIIVGGSFYAGLPLEASFGLGRVGVIDSVRVDWPKGGTQVLYDVAVDRILELVEP